MRQSGQGRKGGSARRLSGLLALFCLAFPAAAEMPPPASTYGDAMRWYARAAEAGDADAQFYLGYAHDRALRKRNSLSKALFWYRRAAAGGDGRAQFRLGLLFDTDRRLPRDPERAKRWYAAAAAQDHAEARFNLARLVEAEDAPRAARLYARAAEAGIAPAAYNLALLRINGPDEVYDPAAAWRWALRAAEMGAPGAEALRDRLEAALDAETRAAPPAPEPPAPEPGCR